MMKFKNGFNRIGGVFGLIAVLALVFGAAYGWCANIVKIFALMNGSFNEVGVEMIVRGFSAFFVIPGIIAGYI